MKLEPLLYSLSFKSPLRVKDKTIFSRSGALFFFGHSALDLSPMPGMQKETLSNAIEQLEYVHKAYPMLLTNPSLTTLTKIDKEYSLYPSVFFSLFCHALGLAFVTDFSEKMSAIKSSYTLIQNPDKPLESGNTDVKLKIKNLSISRSLNLINQLIKDQKKATIRLDLNCSWDLEKTLQFLKILPKENIRYIEDPTDSYDDMQLLSQQSKHAFALDDLLAGADSSILALPQISAFILKPTCRKDFMRFLLPSCHVLNKEIVLSSCYDSPFNVLMLHKLKEYYKTTSITLGCDTLKLFSNASTDAYMENFTKVLEHVC